jgi:hypothetical protein
MKTSVIFISSIFIALAALIFSVALTYPGSSNGALGPGFFPMLLSGIVVLLAVLLIINTLKEKVPAPQSSSKINKTVLGGIGITVFYVIMINIIGFVPSTLAYLLGLMKFFQVKSWPVPVCISVLATGILYGVFTRFLSVQLPRGILF